MKAKTFAGRLTELREDKGVSMYALAKLSGVSKQMLSYLERGEKAPGLAVAQALCRALGVSLAEFDDVEFPTKPIAPRKGKTAHGPAEGTKKRQRGTEGRKKGKE